MAQVQCKTYFSGNYSMMDLNKDVCISWPSSYEDKQLNDHIYEGFVPRPSDWQSEYDRTMLKKIMLEHEVIFKRQVYELHRLYKIQKDLMDEFQEQGQNNHFHFLQAGTLQSNSFSSEMQSEYTKRMWQMHHFPSVSTICNTATIAGSNDVRPPLNFFKEINVQSSVLPNRNTSLHKDSDIEEPKFKSFPRRTFDLQLPADVYIDGEDAGRKGIENLAETSFRYTNPSSKIYSADPMNATKLTLGTGDSTSHQEDNCKSDSLQQNGLPASNLADLVKPGGQKFHDLSTSSVSTHSHSLRTLSEAHGQQLPSSSSMSLLGLQSGRHSDKGSCLNFTYEAMEDREQNRTFFNSESGKTGNGATSSSLGFHNEKLTISSGPIQLMPAQTHEIVFPNNVDTRFGQNSSFGIGISRRIPCLFMLNNSGSSAPGTLDFVPVAPSMDYTCRITPSVSALTKPVNSTGDNCDMVQPFPSFSGSVEVSVQSNRSKTNAWQHIGDLSSHLRLGNDFSTAHLNTKGDGSAFYNNDGREFRKSATDMCLKQALPNGSQNDPTAKQDGGVTAACGISWLNMKPACSKFVDRTKNSSQLEFSISQGYPKQEKEGVSLCSSQNIPSILQVGNQIQRIEVSNNSSCERILGFPILDKTHQITLSLPSCQEKSITCDYNDREKDDTRCIKSPSDFETPSFENQIQAADPSLKIKRLKNLINLNSVYMDNSHSTDKSPEDEMEVPSQITMPAVAAEVTFHSEENALPREESVHISKMDGSDDTEFSQEALIRGAAESIIQLSSDKFSSSHGITCEPSPPAPCDTLRWFAGVLSKVVNARTTRGVGGYSQYSDDVVDHFELMTLMTEETKVEECYHSLPEQENLKEEEMGDASLLLTRPRRGRGKGRRQRRDFQKDILPGLASLTRCEVNEDIQILRGLMESSGTSWEPGLTRRNGMPSRARGRKPKSLAAPLADIQASTLQLQPIPELEVDERMMIGWGRTTKRRRGRPAHRLASQRLPTIVL